MDDVISFLNSLFKQNLLILVFILFLLGFFFLTIFLFICFIKSNLNAIKILKIKAISTIKIKYFQYIFLILFFLFCRLEKMQNLGNISNAIRSKIPVIINKENGNKEDTILLQPSSNHNYNATSNTNISDSKTNKQVDGFDDNFRLERDFSDNDLYSYHDKSSANRIDEWQAGWNVTNAIQVIEFYFTQFFSKILI